MSDLDESDAELEMYQVEPEPEADSVPSSEFIRDDFEEVLEHADEPEVEIDATARMQDFEEVEDDSYEPEQF